MCYDRGAGGRSERQQEGGGIHRLLFLGEEVLHSRSSFAVLLGALLVCKLQL